MSTPLSPSSALVAGLGLCLALFMAGCDNKQDQVDNPSKTAAGASQALGMLVDASTETVLKATTGGDAARALTAGAEPVPDLAARAASSTVIDLATFAVNGQPLFPAGTATGTVTVATTGTATTSWPSGSTQLFSGTVTVGLSNVVLANANGDTLTIASGSFSYTLDANATAHTDALNWTVTTAAAVSVSGLAATLVHKDISHALTFDGNRTVDQTITRVFSTGTTVANTRTIERTIAGNVAGGALTSDTTQAAVNYSRWAMTIDGTPVVWNRNAAVTVTWDYTKPAAQVRTVTAARDWTFISTTLLGQTRIAGPFTAVEASSALRAPVDPAWL